MEKSMTPNEARYLLGPTMVSLITTKSPAKHNIATIGNCIILSKDPVLVGIPVAPGRYTCELIEKSNEFVINIPGDDLQEAVKYCGKVSGRDADKIKELNLTLADSKVIETKGIKECLARIECKVVNSMQLGTHKFFVAEVLSADAAMDYFDGTWKFNDKAPLLFDFKEYHRVIRNNENQKLNKEYEDLPWQYVKERLKASDDVIAVIPIGSIEQHGYGLPLKTDSYIVTQIARQAGRITKDYVLPTIYYGYNEKELDFPGTVSVQAKTLISYLEDVCASLVKVGFKKIVIINGHGWNSPMVKVVGHIINEYKDVTCATLDYWNLCSDFVDQIRESETPGGMAHACEFETSVMLALDPQSVIKENLKKEISYKRSENVWHDLFKKSPVSIPEKFSLLSESGVMGDPELANEEKGRAIVDYTVSKFAKFLDEFRQNF